MDFLKGIEVFLKAAHCASFTRAASAFNITPAMVSIHVASLEKTLGVRLFLRTTRKIALTEEGTELYARFSRIVSEIDETKGLYLKSLAAAGRVRVEVTSTMANFLILPVWHEFNERYPEIQLELSYRGRMFGAADDGYDAVFRYGPFADSSMAAVTLSYANIVVAASPEYLARFGEPMKPEDLCKHQCLQTIDPLTGRTVKWTFLKGREYPQAVPMGAIATSEPETMLEWAVRGFGIVRSADFHLQRDIDAGTLTPILQRFTVRCPPLAILYHKDRHLPSRVRVFLDFMAEKYPPRKKLASAVAALRRRTKPLTRQD